MHESLHPPYRKCRICFLYLNLLKSSIDAFDKSLLGLFMYFVYFRVNKINVYHFSITTLGFLQVLFNFSKALYFCTQLFNMILSIRRVK